ncbi:hypothetical protein AB5J49_28920 [Streptomyces sp. R28]|uniref:Uncharacterized protein n=1 Tax=Streptomyces sp. R28 TaxID=3238628 RepID=A0AB39Q1Q9_9ACTN
MPLDGSEKRSMKTVTSPLRRAAVPVLAAGLLVTAFATPAAAQTPGSTAFRVFGNVFLSARAGAVNNVTAVVVGGNLRLTDTSGIALGPGCSTRVSATTVECGAAGTVGRLSIGLGDLGDTFDGQSVSVRTVVDAGPGLDTSVRTGGGNDTIGVSDGVAGEQVTCGGGTDVVFRDAGDTIGADCEVRY